MTITQNTFITAILSIALLTAGTQAASMPYIQIVLFIAGMYNAYTILMTEDRTEKEEEILTKIHKATRIPGDRK